MARPRSLAPGPPVRPDRKGNPTLGQVDAAPASGVTALALAWLGARRRSRMPELGRPTTGERLAAQGTDLARAAATAGGGLTRLATGATAGAVSLGGIAAAAALRGAGSVSTSVGTGLVALCGEAVARGGGLVVDGGLAVTDLLRGRRRRGAD
jgi:hypothetical protein